jgi:hypothetical protein
MTSNTVTELNTGGALSQGLHEFESVTSSNDLLSRSTARHPVLMAEAVFKSGEKRQLALLLEGHAGVSSTWFVGTMWNGPDGLVRIRCSINNQGAGFAQILH